MQRPCDFASLPNAGDGSDIGAVELHTSPCVSSSALGAFGHRTLVTLKLKKKRIRPGPVPVVVSNGNPFAVSGELSGQTSSRIGGKHKKRVALKAVELRVAKHARETVKLKLSPNLLQGVRRSGALSLRLKAVVHDPAGNTRTVRANVSPKLKSRRR
jgi:hypothetical protein